MKNWVQQISTTQLPIRQATLDRLNYLRDTNDAMLNVADIANVVLSDPLLTYQLLRYAASIQRVRVPMTETIAIEHAIMLIGLDRFFEVFCQLPVIEKQVEPKNMPALAVAYARARLSAWLVKEWLVQADEHRVEEYFVAALLYQVPVCCRALDIPLEPSLTPEMIAKEHIGTSYESIVIGLFSCSNLPAQAFNLLSYSHEMIDRRKLVLRTAIQFACLFDEGWWSRKVGAQLDKAADLLQLPRERLWRVFVNIALFMGRQLRGLPEYARFAQDLVLMPRLPLVSENEFAFLDWSSDPKLVEFDLKIRDTLATLGLQLGCDRLAFFAFNSVDGHLCNHYRIGIEHQDPLVSTRIQPNKAGSFFQSFGQKTQAVRLGTTQIETLRKRFPDESFFAAVADSGCAVISLVYGGIFKGMFYIDNAHNVREIDDAVYLAFKNAVTHLARM